MWWCVRAIEIIGGRLFSQRVIFIGSEDECLNYQRENPYPFNRHCLAVRQELNIEKY